MSDPIPEYIPSQNIPGSFGAVLQAIPVPSAEGADKVGKAIANFGEAAVDMSIKLKHAQESTVATTATTQYLTRLDELEQKTVRDQDQVNAPANFKAAHDDLKTELSANITDPVMRSRAVLEWTRAGISAGKRVSANAFSVERDTNLAALDEAQLPNARAATGADSLIEKQSAIERQFNLNQQATDAGWITDVERQRRNKTFLATVDRADIGTIMRADPVKAATLLDNPENFKNLDPLVREQFLNQAKAQADQAAGLRTAGLTYYNPAGAIATTGQIANPSHGRLIFDQGIVPLASGAVADAADPNYLPNLERWSGLVQRYQGNVWAAAAAFNAGDGKTNAAVYTPEQVAGIRGRYNVARPSPQWGDPAAPNFAGEHLTQIQTAGGKSVTVNKYAARAFQGFITELEASGYKIDDIGGYSDRNILGTNYFSQHKIGNAIDINPARNQVTRDQVVTDLPANVADIAAKYGISWLGEGKSKKDAMHFEFTGVQPVGSAPGGADDWHQAALDRFGPNYTATQLQSVVTDGDTRAFVGRLAKQLNADPDGGGMSPTGRLHAAVAVNAALNGQAADRVRVIKEEAAGANTLFNPTGALKVGNNPDPTEEAVWVEKQQAAAAAGDAESAKRLNEYNLRAELRPAIEQRYGMAPAEQDQSIAAEEARQAVVPVKARDMALLEAMKTVRDDVKKRAHEEPVALLTRAGLGGMPVQVDPASPPDDPQFRAALHARGAQAEAAQRLYQGSSSPFLASEALALKERWNNAGPNEKLGLLRSFALALPQPVYDDAVKAVTGDQRNFNFVGQIARMRPELAGDILRGTELLKSNEVSASANAMRPTFAEKFGGAIYPDPLMQKVVEDAAVALYVARTATNGTLYMNRTAGARAEVAEAIESVAGQIVSRNGVKVAAPLGMSGGQFTDAIDRIDEQFLTRFGGALDRNGRPFDADFIASRATFTQMSPGSSRYMVMLPAGNNKSAAVHTRDGLPLVIDMMQMEPRSVGQIRRTNPVRLQPLLSLPTAPVAQ